jgi:hypothetical protein
MERELWTVVCPDCWQTREEKRDAGEVAGARRDGNPIFDLCDDCQAEEWRREPVHLGCCHEDPRGWEK